MRSPTGSRRCILCFSPASINRRIQPLGWRARCLRLATAAQCIELEDGWTIWQQALTTAAIVPTVKARHFKNALADLTGTNPRTLPLELHDFVWDALNTGKAPIEERIANAS